MITKKICKTHTTQFWLKVVIAVALVMNVLIFARLLMPASICNSQQALGKPETHNKQGMFRIIQPTVHILQLVFDFYQNKPSF